MDPVSLAVGLVTTVAALAYKVHKIITDCEIAEGQFEDLERQFDSAKAALDRLNTIFAYSALPASQLAKYKSEAAKIRDSLIHTEARFRRIRNKLSSPRLFTRFSQKKDLADGGLRGFSTTVSVLCDSLNVLATTYRCTNAQSNEDRRTKMEFAMKEMESAMREMELQAKWNINIIQFVQVVINQQDHPNSSATQSIPVASVESHQCVIINEVSKTLDEDWDFCKYTSDSKLSGLTPSPKTVVNDSSVSAIVKNILHEDFQNSGWHGAQGLDWAEKEQEDAWANHPYP